MKQESDKIFQGVLTTFLHGFMAAKQSHKFKPAYPSSSGDPFGWGHNFQFSIRIVAAKNDDKIVRFFIFTLTKLRVATLDRSVEKAHTATC